MSSSRRAGRALRAAVPALLCAVVVTACSMSNPFGSGSTGPPLTALAHDAVAQYAAAPSVEVVGSYQVGAVPVTVHITMQPSATGAITGNGTYRAQPLTVVGNGGRTLTKGLHYWQAQGAGGLKIWPQFGADWVLAPATDPGASAIGAARDLGGLVAQLGQQADQLRSEGTSQFEGQSVASLRDGATVYLLTTDAPYRLVAVRREGTSHSSGGLSRINLQVHYRGKLEVSLPGSGSYVDPHSASTFPALYEVQSTTAPSGCTSSSCSYSATLVNTTGQQQGQVTATLGLYQDAGFTQLIGSCTTPVPQVGTGQTTTVTCSITDASYQSFYASLSSDGATIYRQVTLQNPPYES